MSEFRDAINQAILGAFCNLWSDQEIASGIVQSRGGLAGAIAAPTNAITGFLNRNLCGRPPNDPVPSPSTGGQCVCAAYQVNVQYTQNGQNLSNTYIADALTTMYGPMSYNGVQAATPGGVPGIGVSYNLCSGGNPTQRVSTVLGSFITEGTEITSVSFSPRFASEPNNCGDQEPILEPPTREETSTTINNFNWTDNSGNTINEGDLNITFGFAYIDANANLTIPFELNIGVDSLFGDINQNGDINFDLSRNTDLGGGGGSCDPRPTDPSLDPDSPVEAPEPIEPVPEPEEERKIIGALVTVTSIDGGRIRATEIFQEENPNIFGPRLGSINFLIQVGSASAAWTQDIDIKNIRQVVEVPWEFGAVGVRGTPIPGVTWQIQPLYNRVNTPVFPISV